jgi:hypothetical protein
VRWIKAENATIQVPNGCDEIIHLFKISQAKTAIFFGDSKDLNEGQPLARDPDELREHLEKLPSDPLAITIRPQNNGDKIEIDGEKILRPEFYEITAGGGKFSRRGLICLSKVDANRLVIKNTSAKIEDCRIGKVVVAEGCSALEFSNCKIGALGSGLTTRT